MIEKLSTIPPDFVAISDYRNAIGDFLEPAFHAFLEAGAGDEISLHENLAAFAKIRLLPRMLSEVAGGNTRIELFGQQLEHPFLLAPIGYQRLFHPRGELESALAAKVTDTPLVLSCLSNSYLEDVARNNDKSWFQLYVTPQPEDNFNLIRKVEKAGFKALVVTIDAPISGIRNREQRAGFAIPSHLKAVNMPKSGDSQMLEPDQSLIFDGYMQNAPNWARIRGIIENTSLPVVLKGILHPADALRAAEIGAKGIVVSNHGGRVLDTAPSAISALPQIVSAAGGDLKILLDGGIRRGSDIFKAIALGADAVLIGRPYIYGLGVAGGLGVAHIIRTLREELEITMALCGTKTIKDINSAFLFKDETGNI